MRLRERGLFLLVAVGAVLSFGIAMVISAESLQQFYLPVIFGRDKEMLEVRALWVTRFDWTTANGADPAKIDEIVTNAASAGFNTLYFQVRGEADAYYSSDFEPWSRRLTGTLGQDPGWDPLERLVQRAHAAGLQVHAYINVYPLWTGCTPPPDNTTPRHLYYEILDFHGSTDGKLNGAQWTDTDAVTCLPYFRVSPASVMFDKHLQEVTEDLVRSYDIDGIHLDHIRYAGQHTSCDPVSEERYGDDCFVSEAYADWQREQVNGTVRKLYEELVPMKPELWLTAAVWPLHRDIYGWGVSSGYDSYYQDSKAWLSGGYIDSVSPMIYTGSPDCSRPYFWTRDRWAMLVADFQGDRNGRFVIPGMGVNYCTADDFAEIVARIETARAEGTAGHAIFSYSGLLAKAYFDDLAAGPYAVPARVPSLAWH